jgi:hypothetical protein
VRWTVRNSCCTIRRRSVSGQLCDIDEITSIRLTDRFQELLLLFRSDAKRLVSLILAPFTLHSSPFTLLQTPLPDRAAAMLEKSTRMSSQSVHEHM